MAGQGVEHVVQIQPLHAAKVVAPAPKVTRERAAWMRWLPRVVLLASVLVVIRSCNDSIVPQVRWSSVGSGPAPEGFTYLQFPVSDAVRVHDAPEGAVTGALSRALGNTVGEEKTSG